MITALIALGILALAASGCGGGENEQDSGIDEGGHDTRPDEFDAGVERPPDARPDERQDRPPVDRYEAPPADRYEALPVDRYEAPLQDRYEAPPSDRYEAPPSDRYEAPEPDRIVDTCPDFDGGLPDRPEDRAILDRFSDMTDLPPDVSDGPRDLPGDRIDAADAADRTDSRPPRRGVRRWRNIIDGDIRAMRPAGPEDGAGRPFYILADSPARIWACGAPTFTDVPPACLIAVEFMTPESGYSSPLLAAGMHPVDFALDGSRAFVNFTNAGGDNTIAAVADVETSDPVRAVRGYDAITSAEHMTHAGGVATAVVPIPIPEHSRYFMAMNGGPTSCGPGLIASYSNQYGRPMIAGLTGFLEGYNPIAARTIYMSVPGRDGGDPLSRVLAVFDAGCSGHDAQIEFIDPVDPELWGVMDPISLGGIAATGARPAWDRREFAWDEMSRKLYLPIDSPKKMVVIDTDTTGVMDIPLYRIGPNPVRRIVSSGLGVFFTQGRGRLMHVVSTAPPIIGTIMLEYGAEPDALMWMGRCIYAGSGRDMQEISPDRVEYETGY